MVPDWMREVIPVRFKENSNFSSTAEDQLVTSDLVYSQEFNLSFDLIGSRWYGGAGVAKLVSTNEYCCQEDDAEGQKGSAGASKAYIGWQGQTVWRPDQDQEVSQGMVTSRPQVGCRES